MLQHLLQHLRRCFRTPAARVVDSVAHKTGPWEENLDASFLADVRKVDLGAVLLQFWKRSAWTTVSDASRAVVFRDMAEGRKVTTTACGQFDLCAMMYLSFQSGKLHKLRMWVRRDFLPNGMGFEHSPDGPLIWSEELTTAWAACVVVGRQTPSFDLHMSEDRSFTVDAERRTQYRAETNRTRAIRCLTWVRDDATIPDDCRCPLALAPFCHPVRASDGFVYERAAILRWLSFNRTSPMTRRKMSARACTFHLKTHLRMKDLIEWQRMQEQEEGGREQEGGREGNGGEEESGEEEVEPRTPVPERRQLL